MTAAVAPVSSTTETKHDKFMRLANKRLPGALEALRLIMQLSARNYENSPEEAEEIIRILDQSMQDVAAAFGVPYSTAFGENADIAKRTNHLITGPTEGPINALDVARAVDFLSRNEIQAAENILKDALRRA